MKNSRFGMRQPSANSSGGMKSIMKISGSNVTCRPKPRPREQRAERDLDERQRQLERQRRRQADAGERDGEQQDQDGKDNFHRFV